MSTYLREKLFMGNRRNQPGIHLRIPPIDFVVVRPKRHIAETVQQEGNKPFPVFFGKL